jgi:hypothetical protein
MLLTQLPRSYNNPASSAVDGPFAQAAIELQGHPLAAHLSGQGFTMQSQGFTGDSSVITYVWTRSLNSTACITDIRLIAAGASAAAAVAAAAAAGYSAVPSTSSPAAASTAAVIMFRRGQTQAITDVQVVLQSGNTSRLTSLGYELVSGVLDAAGAPTQLYVFRQSSRVYVRRFSFTPTASGIIPITLVAQDTSSSCTSAYSITTFAVSILSDGGSAFVESDWQQPLVATMGNVSQFEVRFVSQPLTLPVITPATHDFTGVWHGYCEQFAGLNGDGNLVCAEQACRQSYTIEYAAGRTRYQSLNFIPGSTCTSKNIGQLKPQLLNDGSLHDINLQKFSIGKSLKQGAWFSGVPVTVKVDGLGCYAAWTNGSYYQEQGNYDSSGNYLPGCPDCSGGPIGAGSCSNDGSLSCSSTAFNYRCVAWLGDTKYIKTALASTERILLGAVYQRLAPVPLPNGLSLHTLSVRWDVGPLLSGFSGRYSSPSFKNISASSFSLSVCFVASQPRSFSNLLSTACFGAFLTCSFAVLATALSHPL